MFQYLGEKIPMKDTDEDVYYWEVCFIFCTVYACFALFQTDVQLAYCVYSFACIAYINCSVCCLSNVSLYDWKNNGVQA